MGVAYHFSRWMTSSETAARARATATGPQPEASVVPPVRSRHVPQQLRSSCARTSAVRVQSRHALQALRQRLCDEVLDADLGLYAADPQREAEPFRDANRQLNEGFVHAVPSCRAPREAPGAPCAVPGALVRAVRGRTRDGQCPTPALV